MEPPKTIGELQTCKDKLAECLLAIIHVFEQQCGLVVSELRPIHAQHDDGHIETTEINVELRRSAL